MTKGKKIFIISLSLVLCVAVAIIAVACGNTNNLTAERKAELTQVALASVGASGVETDSSQVSNDQNGNFVVEVVIDGITYSITINENKEVVSIKINERPIDKDHVPAPPFVENGEYITRDEAIDIALQDANVARADVKGLDVEFDYDHGFYLYEVEFRVPMIDTDKTTKFEYDINATTGEIHKKEIDEVTCKHPEYLNENHIGVEAAQQIALEAAGVTAEEVLVWERTKFEFDHGVYVYEVEFTTATEEYEFEINATTGAIIKREHEGMHNGSGNGYQGGREDVAVSMEEAKSVALAHAGIQDASSVVFEEAKLEREHGRYVYEIEFRVGLKEYEYEIDATTGAVLKAERD